jgi:hypothetical protein
LLYSSLHEDKTQHGVKDKRVFKIQTLSGVHNNKLNTKSGQTPWPTPVILATSEVEDHGLRPAWAKS